MQITQFNTLIAGFADNGANTAAELRTMLTAIRDACLIPNEIKWIKMSSTDYSTHFDSTGLAKSTSIYYGFAVCNGNNGTTNDDGKVSIAYGSVYNTLGGTGGNKDAVSQVTTGAGVAGASDHFPAYPTGNALTNANMQPYVIELKIQRVA